MDGAAHIRSVGNIGNFRAGVHDRGAGANEMDAAQGFFIGFVLPGPSKLH